MPLFDDYRKGNYFGHEYDKWDVFIWPYHPRFGNQVVLREDGTDHVVSVDGAPDTGLLYAYEEFRGRSFDNKYRSLYDRLKTEMEAVDDTVSNTYNFQSYQGGAPDTLNNRKLRLIRESGSSDWALNFGHDDWTMDKRLFGFSRDERRVVEPSDDEIQSPYMYWGIWAAPVSAHDKRRYRKRSSHMITSRGRSDGIFTSSAGYWVRKFHYRFVHSPHIFDYHAEDSQKASDAGVDVNDNNNAFEHLWEHADAGPIIVNHHSPLLTGINIYDHWEVCRWTEERTLQDIEEVLTSVDGASGELYDIEFELAILESTFMH